MPKLLGKDSGVTRQGSDIAKLRGVRKPRLHNLNGVSMNFHVVMGYETVAGGNCSHTHGRNSKEVDQGDAVVHVRLILVPIDRSLIGNLAPLGYAWWLFARVFAFNLGTSSSS